MIYVICGPTACGKTSLAIKLANILKCHIINADAFQIYKDMNIGTAKISDNHDLILHYLLNIVSPESEYSIKQYQSDFRNILNLNKDKDIIVCGGSGLYIKSALYDYEFPEYSDDTSDLELLSNDELKNMLINLDFESLANIDGDNRKRIIHAISLARSGHKKSEIISSQEHKLIRDDIKFYFLNPNREELYENINRRVDKMFEGGLVKEVQTLLNKYSLSKTARAAIGYKETIEYLEGKISLDECVNLIKKRTRNYAKRQITFFKHQLPCIEINNIENALESIIHG